MKSILHSIGMVGLAALLSFVLGVAIAGEGDKKLVDALVARSPWTGIFGYGESGPEAGTFTLSFSMKDGKLNGEVGPTSGQGEPMSEVELNDGVLYFVTAKGNQNEMRFKDGMWKGSWFGRARGWAEFSSPKP